MAKNLMQRMLSLILCLCMVVSFVPFEAKADTTVDPRISVGEFVVTFDGVHHVQHGCNHEDATPTITIVKPGSTTSKGQMKVSCPYGHQAYYDLPQLTSAMLKTGADVEYVYDGREKTVYSDVAATGSVVESGVTYQYTDIISSISDGLKLTDAGYYTVLLQYGWKSKTDNTWNGSSVFWTGDSVYDAEKNIYGWPCPRKINIKPHVFTEDELHITAGWDVGYIANKDGSALDTLVAGTYTDVFGETQPLKLLAYPITFKFEGGRFIAVDTSESGSVSTDTLYAGNKNPIVKPGLYRTWYYTELKKAPGTGYMHNYAFPSTDDPDGEVATYGLVLVVPHTLNPLWTEDDPANLTWAPASHDSKAMFRVFDDSHLSGVGSDLVNDFQNGGTQVAKLWVGTTDAPTSVRSIPTLLNGTLNITFNKRTLQSVLPASLAEINTSVAFGTDISGLNLPTVVDVITDGPDVGSGKVNVAKDISVSWSGYNPNMAGEQTLTGTLSLNPTQSGVLQNPNNVKATVKINVSSNTGSYVFEDKTVPYTGSPISMAVTGTTGVASTTYQYVSADGGGYNSSTPPTNVGVYTVTATFTMESGYQQLEPGTATLTITKAKLPGVDPEGFTPEAPTLKDARDTSIELNAQTYNYDSLSLPYEYAIFKDGDWQWQDSPVFSGLTPSTSYNFKQRVKASQNYEASSDSPEASFSTTISGVETTISAKGGITSATYGDGTVELTATVNHGYGSSAAVSYEWFKDGVTTGKSSKSITLTDVADSGSYTCKATVTGDGTGQDESDALSVTISKKTPTVPDPDDPKFSTYVTTSPITYGQILGDTDPQFDYDSFVADHDDAIPGSFRWKTPDDIVHVGDTKVAGTSHILVFVPADAANYNEVEITFPDNKLVVNPKTLTVTANDATTTYNSEVVLGGVSYSGFVGSDSAANLLGTLSVTTTYNKGDDIPSGGTAPIKASGYLASQGSTWSDYSFNYVDGTLTINPMEVSVVWEGLDGEYHSDGTDQSSSIKAHYLDKDSAKVVLTVQFSPNEEFVSPGEYTVTAVDTSASKNNYTLTNNTQTVTMLEEIPDGMVTFPTASDITYGQKLEDSKLSGGDGGSNGKGTYQWKDPSYKPSAGSHTFDVIFTPSPDDEADYSSCAGWDPDTGTVIRKVSVTVNKKSPTKPDIDEEDLKKIVTREKVYDGTVNATVTAADVIDIDPGDDARLVITASYDTKDVGTGKTITVTFRMEGTDAGNYAAPADFSVTDGVITPAPLKITPDASRYQFGDDFERTLSFDGFVAGESESDLAGAVVWNYGGYNRWDDLPDNGQLEVSASGLTSSNYAISFETVTVQTDRMPLAVLAVENQWKTFGDEDPASFLYHIQDYDYTGAKAAGHAVWADVPDDTKAQVVVTVTRDAGEDVGSYEFHSSTDVLKNFDVHQISYAGSNASDDYFDIRGKEVTVQWENLDYLHEADGTDQSDAIKAYYTDNDGNKVYLDLTYEKDGHETAFIEAGSYTVTASDSSSDAGNYILKDNVKTAVMTDGSKTSLVTFPTASPITIGESLADSILSGGNGGSLGTGTYAWADDSFVPTTTGLQSYLVIFTPDAGDTTDYKQEVGWDDATQTVRRMVSVMVNPKSFIDDGDFDDFLAALKPVKNYDGTVDYTIDADAFNDLCSFDPGDDVSVQISGAFTTPTAGVDKVFQVSLRLTGADADQYGYPDGKKGTPAVYDTTGTINRLPLTITANDHTISYGDEVTNAGFTAEGFISGEDEAVLGGTAVYSSSYKKGDDIPAGGTADINVSGLTSENYDITFVPGTLTIEPKEIRVDWTGLDQDYTADGTDQSGSITASIQQDGTTIDLEITFTKDGVESPFKDPGTYVVTASIDNPNYKLVDNKKNITMQTDEEDSLIHFPYASPILVGETLEDSVLYFYPDENMNNGTFDWKDPSFAPPAGTGSYDVVFTPDPSNTTDYSTESGYDPVSGTITRKVTVLVLDGPITPDIPDIFDKMKADGIFDKLYDGTTDTYFAQINETFVDTGLVLMNRNKDNFNFWPRIFGEYNNELSRLVSAGLLNITEASHYADKNVGTDIALTVNFTVGGELSRLVSLPATASSSGDIDKVILVVKANDHSIFTTSPLSNNGVSYPKSDVNADWENDGEVWYYGFVGTDTAASLGGTVSYRYATIAPDGTETPYNQGDGIPADPVNIIPSGLTSSNYDIRYMNGILTLRTPGSIPDPALKQSTANSITLQPIQDGQYTIDGGKTWVDDPKFTGLTPDTAYTFQQRIPDGKGGYVISNEATFKTMPKNAPDYTINYPEETIDFDDGEYEVSRDPNFGDGNDILPGGDITPGDTIYIKDKDTGDITEVPIPDRPEPPDVDVDNKNETINTTTDMEYSTDGGVTWHPCDDDMDIGDFAGEEIWVRYPATDDSFASDPDKVQIPERQEKPDVPDINFKDETLGTTGDMEYSTDGGKTWHPCGDDMDISDMVGDTILIRNPADDDHLASDPIEVPIPDRPNGPALDINFKDETVNTTDDMEYSTDGGKTWHPCDDNMDIGDLTGEDIWVRYPATDDSFASGITKLPIPSRPGSPTIGWTDVSEEGKSDGSITNVTSDMEYSTDGGKTWTKCPNGTISGLPVGDYEVRYAGTDTSFPSYSTHVTIKVDPNGGGIIDGGDKDEPNKGSGNGMGSGDGSVDNDWDNGSMFPGGGGSVPGITDPGQGNNTFCPSDKFVDVNHDLWYHDAIDYTVINNFMFGVSGDHWDPNGTMTRVMLIQVLYRIVGSPDGYEISGVKDVDPSDWYYKAVAWGYHSGVTAGTSKETFDPNEALTYQQMATMIYRFCNTYGLPMITGSMTTTVSDQNEVADYAENAMQAIATTGIMNVNGSTTVAANDTMTRAEAAQVITNFCSAYSSQMTSNTNIQGPTMGIYTNPGVITISGVMLS